MNAQNLSLNPLRMRLVHLSAFSMLATILLFPLVYVFDTPLDASDFLRVLQQILPIFVGFLVSAIGYAFATRREIGVDKERFEMIQFILSCSFIFYWIGLFAICGAFLWSHSKFAALGHGMAKSDLFSLLTLIVSGLTGMVGLISTKIFLEENKASDRVSEAALTGERS